jgi:hypothetical protein
VSDRPIEALHRGLEKYYNLSEDPGRIWIVIIFVPDTDATKKSTGHHHAKKLAQQAEKMEDPNVFEYEYIFEWEVPEQYVEHRVSLQTLLDRGLDLCDYLDDTDHLPDLKTLRKEMTERLLNPSFSGYDIGRSLGRMARCFGARAPVYEIASQLLTDCPRRIVVNHQYQYTSWAGYAEPIDFEHFYWIMLGIEEELSDRWLADHEFLLDYRAHCDWATNIKAKIQARWDLYLEDIYEEVVSGAEPEMSDHYAQALQVREQQIDAEIEKAAIAIGL